MEGTSSVSLIQKYGGVVIQTNTANEAYIQLLANKVDAVLFDAPSVKGFANKHSEEVMVLPPVYAKQYYGIAMPLGSTLRKPINEAILKLQENGTYEKICNKWFGK